MKRPPITISCECGETKSVPYGERWQCEQCGRRWNTQQIPVDDYEGLLRRMRRLRLQVLGFALAAAAVLVPLIVFVSTRFIFLAPIAAFLWIFLYLPFWRRNVRRAAASAPRWELHPE
jgi:hypothetical protein